MTFTSRILFTNPKLQDMIKVDVVKHPRKRGYALKHNQSPGFYGTPDQTWGWYKHKSDAVARANELETQWNNYEPKITRR